MGILCVPKEAGWSFGLFLSGKQPVFQAFQSYPGLFLMMRYDALHMLGISIVSHVTTDNVIHQRIAIFPNDSANPYLTNRGFGIFVCPSHPF